MVSIRNIVYDSYDIAKIILNLDLTLQEQHSLLDAIYEKEKEFLLEQYRDDKMELFKDVSYWMNYLSDEIIQFENRKMEKKLILDGKKLPDNLQLEGNEDMNLFFKLTRLKILYVRNTNYIRIKLRTLLALFGYKRRSKYFVNYVNQCLDFYRIKTYAAGINKCNIATVSINEFITFRVTE